jgi:hypothetical protein
MKIKPIYLLSEIPNDDEGKAFVKQLKKYLNKDQWEVKVRGQHLKKGLDWRHYSYGQPISCSTHLRLYVTIKKSKAVLSDRGFAASVKSHSSYYRKAREVYETNTNRNGV